VQLRIAATFSALRQKQFSRLLLFRRRNDAGGRRVMKKARVVVAGDHPITLAGLRMLIEADADFELVAEATSGPLALSAILSTKPDLAILDISLPQVSGIMLARHLAKECPSVGVIALTSHEDRSYLDQALDAGIRGYVLKKSTAACLLHALRGVLVGGLYIDPAIAGDLMQGSFGKKSGKAPGAPRLTPRETEVLKLVARGLTGKEIASRLGLGAKSIETYRARGAAKIGAKTRSEIVRYASLRGWLADM
jgi:DNA-binding NarL/FixJ family response regulator